jgi:hypothetical protein
LPLPLQLLLPLPALLFVIPQRSGGICGCCCGCHCRCLLFCLSFRSAAEESAVAVAVAVAIAFPHSTSNRVIPTEATHSFIVSSAVEEPPHFAFAVAFALAFVVAYSFR